MEPPLRPAKKIHQMSSRSTQSAFPLAQSLSSPESASPSMSTAEAATLLSGQDEEDRVLPTEKIQDVAPQSTIGQFSFAPATQTTVVTTTTTTTTSFPPLVMKAPRHLNELDPKLYPLASSPTPQAIKRFCFDFAGRPTYFREAEDTSEKLRELREQQASLHASNGTLQSVTNHETRFDLKPRATNDPPSPSKLSNVETRFSSRKRPASPVSISEAARLAIGQRSGNKRRNTSTIPANNNGQSDPLNGQTTYQHKMKATAPTTPDTDHSSLVLALDSRRRGSARSRNHQLSQVQHSPNSPHLEEARTSEAFSTRVGNHTAKSFNEAETVPTAQHAAEIDALDTTSLPITCSATSTLSLVTDVDSISTAPAGLDGVRSARPARLSLLDTAAAQDPSLPSPSLSPVTAAANHGMHGDYFDMTDGEPDTMDSSFELPSLHRVNANSRRDASRRTALKALLPGNHLVIREPSEADFANQQLPTPTMMDIPSMLDSFDAMPAEMKTYVMYQMLRRCPKPALHFVAEVVNPALKCDFLGLLPMELSLNVVKYLDVKSLCRAAQVSKKWRQVIDSDEKVWKDLFDKDGYTLPEGELKQAIKEGWGWQHPYGVDDWEKDLSVSVGIGVGVGVGNVPAWKSDSEWSITSGPSSATNANTNTNGSRAQVATPSTPQSHNARPKRKAAAKFSSRKQQKRREATRESPEEGELDGWMRRFSLTEGPYAAANAAALAVPNPNIGIPSLKNLHLYKSVYQRHHLIRNSWMQDEVQPRHIAFRAHQRHVVTCLQFDTDKILTGSDDTNINVYDTKTGALRTRLEGHEGGVWALQYEGNVLVSGSTDRSVRVWDIEKGVCTQVFQGHTSTVRCLQILLPTEVGKTANGKSIMMPKQPLIITGSRDSNLRVWKLPQPEDKGFFQAGPPPNETDCPYFVRALTGHHHSVRAIAAHADTLVSGSYDCTVRVWKISTGETLHRLQGHSQKVYSVVLDHKRNRCISGSMDNLVKVWSLDSGAVLYNLEGHTSLVGLLDLSDDRLVSAAADSTLRIWDPENGQCKSTLSAHTGAITCFQHDGQKVISGSDRTLKMWNVKTGECVKDLLTDLSGVWQVKFNERRCVAAVQRNNLTYIEVGHSSLLIINKLTPLQVLDFGASRDGLPEDKRGRRIVVDAKGQEMNDPADCSVDFGTTDLENAAEDP
ncbi:MAG: hypothetical protein M1827_005553 [Pycnora praestabilis]|nr:MAG: hypothetical protein M1827_005553 [Pycnora praestabilis]